MTAKFTVNNYDMQFDDTDVVEPSAFIPAGEFNPHNVRPWLLHDHGFTVAVVFASCLQDAIDEAVDSGKMDRYMVKEEDMADYPEEEGISFLGNASEPFDIGTLDALELPNPAYSFAAMFMEAQKEADLRAAIKAA
jgi:hypothetical protein